MDQFVLGDREHPVMFYREAAAYPGVRRVAAKVRGDILHVIGEEPEETDDAGRLGRYPVIYGTIGKSPALDAMERSGRLNLSGVRGRWEVYSVQIVDHPMDGVEQALVLAGSDKRGTIYGLFHLSELLGVSPFTDWAGVLPARRDRVVLTAAVNGTSKVPSVRYRGFFINDEWPAFGTWAFCHFGGVNAALYDHVFELLLRLKGNCLWPAMWSACFSCDGPGLASAELADEYGVVIGTSHHEPCMRNGAEYGHVRGKGSVYGDAWDFRANREGITKFWADGLKRNGRFENIVTVGMRGENDSKILGEDATVAENIDLLRDVLKTQNSLIRTYVNPDLSQVRRAFILFTEVESFFYGDGQTKGLMGDPLLDGVTIMLCDDNFGGLRSQPTPGMRRHRGGYGLYYHLDFHGGPVSYEWTNANYLPKMWEQLTTAYDAGMREIWIANVGDIGQLEYPLSCFMDLAYDIGCMGESSAPGQVEEYTRRWADVQFRGIFSEPDRQNVSEILREYTRINMNRKPETMNADVYHPVHFGEADAVLRQARRVTDRAEELLARCPEQALPAYYELVYYPAAASANLCRMWIYAGKNAFFAWQGRTEANRLADAVSGCIAEDRRLTEAYHGVGSGKWYGMGLSEHIGFTHWCDEDCKYPRMVRIEPANHPRLIAASSHSTEYTVGMFWSGNTIRVTDFLQQNIAEAQVDLACGSRGGIRYRAETDCPWLSLSPKAGIVSDKEVLTLRIDRSRLTGRETGTVWVRTSFSGVRILVEAQNADTSGLPPMTFLEANGYIAMEAEHCCRKQDADGIGFHRLDAYGRTGSAMKVLPPRSSDFTGKQPRPFLEYSLLAERDGVYEADFYLAPLLPARIGSRTSFGLMMNDGEMKMEHAADYRFCSPEWSRSVVENIQIHHTRVLCRKGVNRLRVYAASPCFVLEKIVLYPENTVLPESYLGPAESFHTAAGSGT